MGLNSDTGKGTVYINGEPFSEVSEIKIAPRQKEPSSFPLTFEKMLIFCKNRENLIVDAVNQSKKLIEW